MTYIKCLTILVNLYMMLNMFKGGIMGNRKYTMGDIKKTIKTMLKNLHKDKLKVYKSRAVFQDHDIYEARIEGAEYILKILQRKYFKETKENGNGK